jgi:phage-related holin
MSTCQSLLIVVLLNVYRPFFAVASSVEYLQVSHSYLFGAVQCYMSSLVLLVLLNVYRPVLAVAAACGGRLQASY